MIILFGLVSLFGDIVYEGARSVNGPYLKTLGVSAAIVGLVAGLGELLGYALRLVSGYFADKTRAYWIFTISGYAMLVSVPLLSLTGAWQTAAIFIVLERIGKALRSPAKDTIVSEAAREVGTGFGFGLQEAMDQIGAMAGPLIFMLFFVSLGRRDYTAVDYRSGYALLWIPFILVMLSLVLAYRLVPHTERFDAAVSKVQPSDNLSKVFWLYALFSFVATAGFANFALLGYHFKSKNILSDAQIPFFYCLAMGIDGLAALIIGRAYDRLKRKNNNEQAGLFTLLLIPLLSLFIPLCVFLKDYRIVIAGVLLWGVVMGAHETIMKSAIADITPLRKRGTGYGIFNALYGLAMFAGSVLMGILYDRSVALLIAISIAIEVIAVAIFFMMKKEVLKARVNVNSIIPKEPGE